MTNEPRQRDVRMTLTKQRLDSDNDAAAGTKGEVDTMIAPSDASIVTDQTAISFLGWAGALVIGAALWTAIFAIAT